MFFFVCIFRQDYCESNRSISLKLDIMTGPTNGVNRLTFGSDLVPDTDSGSLYHFPQHCRMGHFRRSISISHTVTLFTKLVKMTDANKRVNPLHFGSDLPDIRICINPDSNSRSLLVEATTAQGVRYTWCSVGGGICTQSSVSFSLLLRIIGAITTQ